MTMISTCILHQTTTIPLGKSEAKSSEAAEPEKRADIFLYGNERTFKLFEVEGNRIPQGHQGDDAIALPEKWLI